MSYSYTTSETFTLTNARKLAAKVIADMNQCRLFYSEPSVDDIAQYETELVVMLAGRYVTTYEFGFKSADDRRIVSWKYRVTSTGDVEGGRSGGVHATADVSAGRFFNFLTTNDAWGRLTPDQRAAEKVKHEVTRTIGDPPADGSGRWIRDRTYSSGGVALNREEFRPS